MSVAVGSNLHNRLGNVKKAALRTRNEHDCYSFYSKLLRDNIECFRKLQKSKKEVVGTDCKSEGVYKHI